MMTNAQTVTHKTPLAKWLFEHDITLREGARLFHTSRTSLGAYARGEKVPTGKPRELIAKVLLNECTINDLRKGAEA